VTTGTDKAVVATTVEMKSVETKSQISASRAANKKTRSINPKMLRIKRRVVIKSV
jgi:hypothetical protein